MPALQEEAAKNSSEQGDGVTRVGSYLYLILSVHTYLRELFGVRSRPLLSVQSAYWISIPPILFSLHPGRSGERNGKEGIWPETHSTGGEVWYGVTVCLVSGIQTSRKMLEGPTEQLHFLSTNYSTCYYFIPLILLDYY
jgi:hypothetical protein